MDEQDKKDAARYRWLRDHPQSVWEVRYLQPYRFICKVPFEHLDAIPGTLDAAIDAAMNSAHSAAGEQRGDQ